ncbi:MAG: SMP-30/gluconolactonase/LRE family protein [Bacteroidota bacterium]|jgi:gluconolactonase
MTKLYCFLLLLLPLAALAQSPVPLGATVEKIATGFMQPEGPVWKDGAGLLFSDIQRSTIYRWSQADSITIYLHPSDSSNGLTFDLQGRLILTQMRLRRVARQELNGTITPLASTYNGKKFNSPNDVVVKSDSSIFFTDPDFNIPTNQKKELTFQGIYSISPSGSLSLLDSSLNKPNGICFSLDEKKLYVNESAIGNIYVWDVVNDSTIRNKKSFYTIPLGGYADGMKVDTAGNLYCSGPRGVWVISPSGICLDTILMPNNVGASNCNWGDADRKTLYITSGTSLYRIRLGTTTGVKDHDSLPPKTFELYGNYPNPFNPATMIYFQLPYKSQVTLNVYDIRGRKIDTLIDGILQSGYHQVQFNPKGLSSGIYLYRLTAGIGEAGMYSATRKMIVLK